MRIAQLLHEARHREDSGFIAEAFRQLLNREPSAEEASRSMQLLASGVSKNEMMIRLFTSEEASLLYRQAHRSVPHTAAAKLQALMRLPNANFAASLYIEMFCRTGEEASCAKISAALEQGKPRMAVMTDFLSSDEWLHLMESDKQVIVRRMLSCFLTSR